MPDASLPSLPETSSGSPEETPVNRKASTMVCFCLALIHHSTEPVVGTGLIMIKTITESSVDTGGDATIHPSAIFIKQITSTSSK